MFVTEVSWTGRHLGVKSLEDAYLYPALHHIIVLGHTNVECSKLADLLRDYIYILMHKRYKFIWTLVNQMVMGQSCTQSCTCECVWERNWVKVCVPACTDIYTCIYSFVIFSVLIIDRNWFWNQNFYKISALIWWQKYNESNFLKLCFPDKVLQIVFHWLQSFSQHILAFILPEKMNKSYFI